MKNKRYVVNNSRYQMVKRKNLECGKKGECFNLSPGGEICMVPFTLTSAFIIMLLRPTWFSYGRYLRSRNVEFNFLLSSGERLLKHVGRLQRWTAVDRRDSRRRPRQQQQLLTSVHNKPGSRLLKGKRNGEDIYNAFASAAARFLLGNLVYFRSEMCAAGVCLIRTWWSGWANTRWDTIIPLNEPQSPIANISTRECGCGVSEGSDRDPPGVYGGHKGPLAMAF